MKPLLKNTVLLSIPSIANLFLGVIRAKINAVYLGPVGVGMLNQANAFIVNTTNLPQLGKQNALVKLAAEAKGDSDSWNRMMNTFQTIVLIIFIPLLSAIFLYQDAINHWFFDDSAGKYLIVSCAVAIVFAIRKNVLRSMLNGTSRFKDLSIADTLSAVALFIIMVPLIIFFGIAGLAIYFLVYYFIDLVLCTFIYRRNDTKTNTSFLIDKKYAKEFITFGAVGIFSGLAFYLAQLGTRILVVQHVGLEGLGFYSPALSLTGIYMSTVIPAISTYLYPRLASIRTETATATRELNDAVRLVLLLTIPPAFILVSCRYWIVPMLYSQKFLPAAEFFPFQVLADIGKAVAWIMGTALQPMGFIKAFGVLEVTFNAFLVLLAYLLIPSIGVKGLIISYLLMSILQIILYGLFLRRRLGFVPSMRGIVIVGTSVLLLIIAGFTALPLGVLFLMFGVWVIVNITKQDYQQIAILLKHEREIH
jgi:O-antigen/teichoic acid export membrane protein